MSRIARRNIVTPEGGFFHVLNRVAGSPKWLPFRNPGIRRHLLARLRKCLNFSCIQAASFTLMGNHFHLIVFVEKFRKLGRAELERFARRRWGRGWKIRTRYWSNQRWEQFNRDLFSLDVFMRDFQGPFAAWFNRTYKRRGHFWADRYKCIALDDYQALQECLFYVELNPVRAGLVRQPQEWKEGSAYLRWTGRGRFLLSLQKIFPQVPRDELMSYYQSELLYRGARPGDAITRCDDLIRPLNGECRNRHPGLYLQRMRFFVDGLIIGGAEPISSRLQTFRRLEIYKRRQRPINQLGGLLYSLRPQRSHARV